MASAESMARLIYYVFTPIRSAFSYLISCGLSCSTGCNCWYNRALLLSGLLPRSSFSFDESTLVKVAPFFGVLEIEKVSPAKFLPGLCTASAASAYPATVFEAPNSLLRPSIGLIYDSSLRVFPRNSECDSY